VSESESEREGEIVRCPARDDPTFHSCLTQGWRAYITPYLMWRGTHLLLFVHVCVDGWMLTDEPFLSSCPPYPPTPPSLEPVPTAHCVSMVCAPHQARESHAQRHTELDPHDTPPAFRDERCEGMFEEAAANQHPGRPCPRCQSRQREWVWVSECEVRCGRWCATRDDPTLTPCLTRMKHRPYNPYTRADVVVAPTEMWGDGGCEWEWEWEGGRNSEVPRVWWPNVSLLSDARMASIHYTLSDVTWHPPPLVCTCVCRWMNADWWAFPFFLPTIPPNPAFSGACADCALR